MLAWFPLAFANPTETPSPHDDSVPLPAVGPRLGLAVGVSGLIGRSSRHGEVPPKLSGGLTVRASRSIAVELEGSATPDLGRSRWRRDDEESTAPLDPRTAARASALTRLTFSPFLGDVVLAGSKPLPIALDLSVGGGVVRTVDEIDLAVLAPDATLTVMQLHPAVGWAIGPRVSLSRRFDLRVRFDGLHWVEAYARDADVPVHQRSLASRVGFGGMFGVRL